MKMTIDPKSALVGLLAGVAAMLAIGAGTSSNETGRFQVSAGGAGFAVMVDTKTRQAWSFQPTSTALWRSDESFWREK